MTTRTVILLTLVCGLVAGTAPAMAGNTRGVQFQEVTFTDSSTPSFGAPCPLAPDLAFDRVDQGTVEGQLEGTITACLQFASGLVPQASGLVEIATADVTWRGTFLAFVAAGLTEGTLATGEFFADGTDGTKLRGSFTQFQIGDPSQDPPVPDRFLDRAIIIQPPHGD
jgi:hypothetical protein